jgi:hypothetical protein
MALAMRLACRRAAWPSWPAACRGARWPCRRRRQRHARLTGGATDPVADRRARDAAGRARRCAGGPRPRAGRGRAGPARPRVDAGTGLRHAAPARPPRPPAGRPWPAGGLTRWTRTSSTSCGSARTSSRRWAACPRTPRSPSRSSWPSASGGRRASGFVNGVLQSLRRAGARRPSPTSRRTRGAPGYVGLAPAVAGGALDRTRSAPTPRGGWSTRTTAAGAVPAGAGRRPGRPRHAGAAGVGVEAVPGAPQALRLLEGSVTTRWRPRPSSCRTRRRGWWSRSRTRRPAPGSWTWRRRRAARRWHWRRPARRARVVVAADVSRAGWRGCAERGPLSVAPRDGATGVTLVAPVVADGRQPPFRPVDWCCWTRRARGRARCAGIRTAAGAWGRRTWRRWCVAAALLDAAARSWSPVAAGVFDVLAGAEENEDQVEAFWSGTVSSCWSRARRRTRCCAPARCGAAARAWLGRRVRRPAAAVRARAG